MTIISQLHGALSNTIWLFYLFLGLWGLYRAIRRQPVSGSYLGAIAVIQIVIVVQALMGGALYLGGNRPGRELVHYLYAAFGVVFLPGVFAYLKGDDSNTAQWIFALGSLFMYGVVRRIIETAV
jgi:hypothetical protein